MLRTTNEFSPPRNFQPLWPRLKTIEGGSSLCCYKDVIQTCSLFVLSCHLDMLPSWSGRPLFSERQLEMLFEASEYAV